MSALKIGELFAGYGGLGAGVQAALGGEIAWVSEFDKGPSKILAHRFPGVPNHGDITTIDWSQVEPVDILTGGSPCFVAGTPVLTKRGSVAIEEVVVGDEVWTHRNRWQRVTNTMSRTSEIVRVGPVVTTPDHPFYSRPLVRQWNNDVRQYRTLLGAESDWVRADKTQGQALATPLSINGESEVLLCDPWLAGRYVADGWANRSQVMVAVGDGKAEAFEREVGNLAWTTSQSGPSCTRYSLSDNALAEWLPTHFGKGAAHKTIPTFILTADVETRERFLAGYLSGDGSNPSEGHWVANTVSANLASQLRLLAIGLGRTSQISVVKTPPMTEIEGRTVNQRDYWSVTMRPNGHRYTFDADGMHWFKQRKPVDVIGEDTVYDITVENDHSFLAWGYVVHNCQDLSHAGARKGMTEGTRSNLWVAMREAIAQLKPSLVVWENVGGAFSANASSEVEPCAGCVGDGSGINLRALGRVLGDLASLGFDAEWTALRAADIGAPHGRLRVFVVAYPAGDKERQQHGDGGLAAVAADLGHERGGPSRDGRTGPADSDRGPSLITLPTPTARDWKNVGDPAKTAGRMADRGQPLGEVVVNALLPTPAVNDMGAAYTPEEWDAWTAEMKAKHNNGNGHGKSLNVEAQRLLPTPTSRDWRDHETLVEDERRGKDTLARALHVELLPTPRATDGTKGGPNQAGSSGDLMLPSAVQASRWGEYEPAIRRWESVTRPAPDPTKLNSKGSPKLSDDFDEWLMGYPAGWITDVPGVTWNQTLKGCGNGVVPQQGAAAVRWLLVQMQARAVA